MSDHRSKLQITLQAYSAQPQCNISDHSALCPEMLHCAIHDIIRQVTLL